MQLVISPDKMVTSYERLDVTRETCNYIYLLQTRVKFIYLAEPPGGLLSKKWAFLHKHGISIVI